MNKTLKLTYDIYKTIRTESCKQVFGYGKKTMQDAIRDGNLTPKQKEKIKEHLGEWIDDIQSRYMDCFK